MPKSNNNSIVDEEEEVSDMQRHCTGFIEIGLEEMFGAHEKNNNLIPGNQMQEFHDIMVEKYKRL